MRRRLTFLFFPGPVGSNELLRLVMSDGQKDSVPTEQYEVWDRSSGKYVKCDICGTGFSNRGNLNTHMKRAHKGEKPYACQFCCERFGHQTQLRRHEVIHSGQRPHKCVICNVSYIDGFSLKRHMLRHEEFACTSCPAIFSSYDMLADHVHVMGHEAHCRSQNLVWKWRTLLRKNYLFLSTQVENLNTTCAFNCSINL